MFFNRNTYLKFMILLLNFYRIEDRSTFNRVMLHIMNIKQKIKFIILASFLILPANTE